ncbi:Glycosyltransferase involved in cell wall bisynthesis [Neorhodopirellula lusitana]|uniref:Glycosyltransferase involved in cell wall bisynthesis n=1 Tax=Neorhodopirellula lusitana TaxID=445327 RepID=A0ABY1PYF7_9BACT|nr:glycosyltransferase family 4 protein [Neorhodopirellula lusitana]SMP51676.1 Glycosyltransferase involved in cell wall bisynthesis [Neorhodopirellula lusitana]
MTSDSPTDISEGPSQPLVVQITTVPQTLYRLFPAVITFLKQKDYKIKAISSAGSWKKSDEVAEFLNIEIGEVNLSRSFSPVRDFVALLQTMRMLRRWRPEIVHCHTPKGGLIGGLASWLVRVPCRIYTVRGLPHTTATGVMRFLLLTSERVSCAMAHRIILVSPSVRDELISLRIGDRAKMVVPGSGSAQGVDADRRFDPVQVRSRYPASARSELGIAESDFVVGFVGRLTRDKGVKELWETWQRVREFSPDSHLVIAGANNEPRRGDVDEVLESLNQDTHVHIVGNVEAIEKYYVAMDLLLFPSYREGFSNAILEASAMAMPTVAFDVVGCRDGVRDGVTGFLVPVHDSNAMADRVIQLCRDGKMRRQLGRDAREWVLREFQPSDRLVMLEQEYSTLLSKRITL